MTKINHTNNIFQKMYLNMLLVGVTKMSYAQSINIIHKNNNSKEHRKHIFLEYNLLPGRCFTNIIQMLLYMSRHQVKMYHRTTRQTLKSLLLPNFTRSNGRYYNTKKFIECDDRRRVNEWYRIHTHIVMVSAEFWIILTVLVDFDIHLLQITHRCHLQFKPNAFKGDINKS